MHGSRHRNGGRSERPPFLCSGETGYRVATTVRDPGSTIRSFRPTIPPSVAAPMARMMAIVVPHAPGPAASGCCFAGLLRRLLRLPSEPRPQGSRRPDRPRSASLREQRLGRQPPWPRGAAAPARLLTVEAKNPSAPVSAVVASQRSSRSVAAPVTNPLSGPSDSDRVAAARAAIQPPKKKATRRLKPPQIPAAVPQVCGSLSCRRRGR